MLIRDCCMGCTQENSQNIAQRMEKQNQISQEGDRAERGSLQVYILTQKKGFDLAWNRTDMGARIIIE